MSIDRVRYQAGTVEFRRETGKFYFRYRDAEGHRPSVILGTAEELSTAAKLKRATDAMRAKVNAELGACFDRGMLMAELIELYKLDGLPEHPSTRRGYLSKLKNHIIPRWGNVPVTEMMNRAYEVELWLKHMEASGKSKVHLRGLLSILLEHAMRIRVVPVGVNPMSLVRIKGATRRQSEPIILTYEQFAALLAELHEPYRTMAVLAGALGLRASEIIGLRWRDWDPMGLTITLRQAVVNTDEGDLKTPESKSILPIASEVADLLARWKDATHFAKPEDWVFASPFKAGRMPYHAWSAQYWALAPAGRRAGIGNVGWHDLRHSYRSWLDQTGAPIGVQKDCLRHASIVTTMDKYGAAVMSAKRKAHGNVVQMLKKAAGGL
jgi:integrase